MAKIIELTRGKQAIVDDSDFEYLSRFKWIAVVGPGRYASCTELNKAGHEYLMHRVIERPPVGTIVDHKNGNGLDNRRSNLRICNVSQNRANSVKQQNSRSLFKGVWIRTRRRRTMYYAQISVCGRMTHIGSYETEKEAALAYDIAASRLYGEFAKTNRMLGLL